MTATLLSSGSDDSGTRLAFPKERPRLAAVIRPHPAQRGWARLAASVTLTNGAVQGECTGAIRRGRRSLRRDAQLSSSSFSRQPST